MTIPKSIREKLGIRIGDAVEVTADNVGRIVARKLEPEKATPLDWGEEFRRKHSITEAGIVRILRGTRREVFKEEYE